MKIEIKDFDNQIKKKKKAITLYLSSDTFDYVKKHLKNKSVSSFVDGLLEQLKSKLELDMRK